MTSKQESEGTLDDLFNAIWKLRDVGWKAREDIAIRCDRNGRWSVHLCDRNHYGTDVSDAAAGLYQDLREKAEAQWTAKQGDATKWREACDWPVPKWAWPPDEAAR